MKKLVIFPVTLLVLFVLGCTDAAKPPVAVEAPPATPAVAQDAHTDDGHDAPRISLEEAKKDFDNKSAVFIDTHSKEQFEVEHIPGAINLQANTIKQNLDKVPKGKKIIAYCS